MGTKVVYGAWKFKKKSTEEMKIRMDERQCSNITTIAREEQERFFNSSISQRIDDLEKLNEQRFQEK